MLYSKPCYLALALSSIFTVNSAYAQQPDSSVPDLKDTKQQSTETIVVTGTRSSARSLFDTMAPIDVFSKDEVDATASSELTDVLATLAPSFNVQRLPMNDGLVFVRPATLRGLSPDHTLVLINGKRRHRSALLGSRGAQGADLAQIPVAAIKRIEVLRDGAAAQYGSDAIAGVINIILEDSTGVSGYTQIGEYFEGDGQEWQTAIQAGAKLGTDGFINATFEYTDADMTSRTRQRPDAIAFEEATGVKVNDPVQNWGQPERDATRVALNSEGYLGETRWYAYGTYGESQGVSDFNWRNPLTSSAYQPSPENYPDYNLNELYPAGFSPKFKQEDEDNSLIIGLNGDITPDFSWDSSVNYGRNIINYFMGESINASLGTESPTDFYIGELQQTEVNMNLDFVYLWDNPLFAYSANVAFGLESREETYEVGSGDYASYAVGAAAREGLPSGSNGFPGFGPQQEGKYDQRSNAAYIDLEIPITENLTSGIATRFEDFSEFGDTLDGKFSLRYEMTPNFAFRGTVSTGFRAPTPGQLESTRISQGLDTETLNLFTSGRLSPSSPVAQYFGAEPLEAEESKSYTLGFTLRNDSGFSGSLDIYQIDVDNRFGESQRFTVTDSIRQELLTQGVAGAESFTSVSFYTNAFDTKTRGVDLAGSYYLPTSNGNLKLTGAINYNDTEVVRQNGNISDYGVTRIEDGLPNWNANVSATWQLDAWQLYARARYFGEWTDAAAQDSGNIFQDFGAEVVFDLAVSWQMSPQFKVKLGAENIFDNYPDEAGFQANRGLIYSRNAPYDTDGGQYYLRFDYRF